MPPPDQQQVVKLPMPEGMNTVLPPYKLPSKRSPYILNMVSLNGQLVGRAGMVGATTSAQTNRYPISYISISGRGVSSDQLTMIYQYIKTPSTTWYFPPYLFFGVPVSYPPSIVTTPINQLGSNTSDFTYSYYIGEAKHFYMLIMKQYQ